MRNIYGPTLIGLSLFVLAGCTAAPAEPDASPEPPIATPTSSPTASAEAPLLAISGDANEALQTSPNDDRAPFISFYTVLDGAEPQNFADSTELTSGPANLRIACASENSTVVTVDFTPAGGTTTTTEAPCGEATSTSTSFITIQGEPFDLSGPWKVTVTNENRAAVAIGIVRD